VDSLLGLLETFWTALTARGGRPGHLASSIAVAPATCNLMNPDKEKTVEQAFGILRSSQERSEKSTV